MFCECAAFNLFPVFSAQNRLQVKCLSGEQSQVYDGWWTANDISANIFVRIGAHSSHLV